MMQLYKVWVDDYGYDEYDSAVVCAENEEDAKKILSSYGAPMWIKTKFVNNKLIEMTKDIHVKHIGVALKDQKEGPILESFNAS